MNYNKFRDILLLHQYKIVVLLLINSLSLWFLTIYSTHIYRYPPDTFYYMTQLPVFYWVGMTLILTTFILLLYLFNLQKSKKYDFTCLLLVIILILYLFGTEIFIYKNLRFLDASSVANNINSVIGAGYLEKPSTNEIYYLYYFPLSSLFFSIASQILGLNALVFAKFYPIILMFILSILIMATSIKYSKEYAIVAPVTLLSFSWIQEYHLSPQSYAYMLTAVLLFLLIDLLIYGKKNKGLEILLIIVVFMVIIITHPSTPIINMVSFLFLFFIYMTLKLYYKKNHIFPEMENVQALLIFFVITYIAYILFISNFMFELIIRVFQRIADSLIQKQGAILEGALITTPMPSYELLIRIRWAEIVAVILLGLSSILFLYKSYTNKKFIYVVGGLFIGYLSLAAGLVIGGYSYGTDRSYMFSLIPYSLLTSTVFCVKLDLKKRSEKYFKIFKIVILLSIIISAFLIPATRNGSDPSNFVPDSEIAGNQFTSEYMNTFNIINPYSLLSNFSKEDKIQTGAFVVYLTTWYNLLEIKQQKGKEYNEWLDSDKFNEFYDGSQIKIYQRR